MRTSLGTKPRSIMSAAAIILLCFMPFSVSAFATIQQQALHAPTKTIRIHTTLSLSNSDNNGGDDGGIDDFESNRMDIVRSLQKSFYMPESPTAIPDGDNDDETASYVTSSCPRAQLDESKGKIINLPLWRVGWIETPGRRNCLNVHEGIYTHMFESILSTQSETNDPLYFGHLYLPGGTKAAKSGEERYRLKTWREELDDDDRFDNYSKSSTLNAPEISTPSVDRSAVVGCLMQIVDHRRMEDGRLMLLVQAVERFVVDEVLETLPYSVANVQILLDKEDLQFKGDDNDKNEQVDENFCKYLRGDAVTASFFYHDYEFNKPKLPIGEKNNSYLSKDDVPWVEISNLLPFAEYSSDDVSLNAANEKSSSMQESLLASMNNGDASSNFAEGELSMEEQLFNGGILWDPPFIQNVIVRRSLDTSDCDALETLLWLAMDDFCRATGFNLPEEVRVLMPPEMDYLDQMPSEHALSPLYPKIRRQRRLSYLAPALIENLEEVGKGIRHIWLNTPSTNARLRGALERYDYLNNKLMGQFE
mmetsp:Transcript_4414/g.9197  ORF Transcript_4414/g.9197 Transcript_4414/m.9197 type:complete len:534 (-) Transcript_4414:23-1624(-)